MTAPAAVRRPEGRGAWRGRSTAGYDTGPLSGPRSRRWPSWAGLRRRARTNRPPGVAVIRRLLRPLDEAAAAWCTPASHRRRAVPDATGLILQRCAESGGVLGVDG